MILPWEGHHPLRGKIWLVHALIAANVAVFILSLLSGSFAPIISRFGFIPAHPLPDAFFTCMFLHADLWHLGGNMLFLWMYGDNLEDRLGAWFFAGLYLLTGTFATFSHWIYAPGSTIPLVGASGAISGLMGAYAVLFPKARFQILLSVGGLLRLLRLPILRWAMIPLGNWPAMAAIPAWLGIQVLGALSYKGGTAGVAFWAHVGGALAGAAFALALIQGGWARIDPEAGAKPKRKK